jgi:segregation and condensation protein A
MYTIKLPNFEGPLDLLLYFIKRDEMDIYDIPIANITKEFLEYVRLMHLFDLELAGEFLVMASTLMQIKVKMLLPKEVNEQGEELPTEDPRAELVRQLLQYSLYKEISREILDRSESQRYIYYRSLFDAEVQETSNEPYKNATLFDLLGAFKKALERKPAQVITHTVQLYSITVEEQTENLIMELRGKRALSFLGFVESKPKLFIVVTFLALLEMSKNQIISIRQNDNFDDIEIIPFDDVMESKMLEEVLAPLHISSSETSSTIV